MIYRLNVEVNDLDYYDFNIFTLIRSSDARKQRITFRIALTAIIAFVALLPLITEGSSAEFWISRIPYAIVCIVLQLAWIPFLKGAVKSSIKSAKKKGKTMYTPKSELQFFDDRFVETVDGKETEKKYRELYKICVIEEKIIYIYAKKNEAYLLPYTAFSDSSEIDGFLDFLKLNCSTVEFYK